MLKTKTKLMATGALCAVLLAGCGGGGDDNVGAQGSVTPPQRTITAVVDFIKNLIASNGENTDPIDINSLTLAVDDKAEPAALD